LTNYNYEIITNQSQLEIIFVVTPDNQECEINKLNLTFVNLFGVNVSLYTMEISQSTLKNTSL
jgi:hypothetical protein